MGSERRGVYQSKYNRQNVLNNKNRKKDASQKRGVLEQSKRATIEDRLSKHKGGQRKPERKTQPTKTFKGAKLEEQQGENKTQEAPQGKENLKDCKIFVRGINCKQITAETLRKIFTKHGTVVSSEVLDASFVVSKGKSNGYGFVTMSTAVEAANALKITERKIDGHVVQCSLATTQKQ